MGFKIKAPKLKLDKKSLGNWGRNLAGAYGATVGGVYGALATNSLLKKPKSPAIPGESPETTALRAKMYDEANQYRQDMPGLMKEQEDVLQSDANKAINTGVEGERTNYNNRGLLYSGMRQGAEADVKGRVASELARSTADVRKGYEDTARAKESVATQVGLSGYQAALQRAEDVYSLQAAKNTANRQQMQQLGQAAGYVGMRGAQGDFNQNDPRNRWGYRPMFTTETYSTGGPSGLMRA